MVLNVVGGQEWSGFCRFGRQKNAMSGCIKNRADGGINVVKCDGNERGGCSWEQPPLLCGFRRCRKRRMEDVEKLDCGYRREDPGLKALFSCLYSGA